ncbi:SURF1 family cytochrome oxidase biogenesis protein [Kineococcus sp. SYSU DK005]|uniref:SURF1 family cytochrome oxidase biogenesis protein n=1 Tax=Kineococcus sp. SYSU DK005 TaxID=3383126 RepID=UPI003D7D4B83
MRSGTTPAGARAGGQPAAPVPAGAGARGTGARGVLGLLREQRWRRGLALAVAVGVVCVLLGQWQWHRRQARLAANAPLVGNYDAAPVPVDEVLPAGGAPLAARDAWTPVRVSGTYDAGATVLARNRQLGDAVGYDVLVPLVLADGTALLVDRGWVPAGSTSSAPDAVPAAPGGTVSVTARVRPWEPARRSSVPAGQVASIAQEPVRRVTGAAGVARLRGGYAVLASEEPAPAVALPRAGRPEVDEGPHLAYTVQWYGFALTALVVWVVAGRRELQARELQVRGALSAPGAAPDGGGAAGGDDVPGGAPGGRDEGGAVPGAATGAGPGAARPARRRPVRVARPGSDEEAEDAEVEAGARPRR